MNSRSYALAFACFAILFIIAGEFVFFLSISLLCYWCAVSCVLMSTAYFFQCPKLVMGKTSGTIFGAMIFILNLPFLAFYWLVWLLRHAFSSKPPVCRIGDTNVSVSQYPIFRVPLDQYDVIFDLTAEMPAIYRVRGKYVAIPNLDGVPLSQWDVPLEIDRNQRILVHCAQGRGRSAVYAAMLLKKLGYVSDADTACQWLKQSRPVVHLTKAQRRQLDCLIN